MAGSTPLRLLAESDSEFLSVDMTGMLIFGAVMLVLTVAVVIWALLVPERPPARDHDAAGEIVAREEERAATVVRDLEEDTGRADPLTRRVP